MKIKDLILNPYFLTGLGLLIGNDLVLKWYYANPITGKLSDFAGLFILPIFIANMLPGSKKSIALLIGILFILWKSPISTPIIELVNSFSVLSFNRIVDYTDLIALSILPICHAIINNEKYQALPQYGLYVYLKVLTLVTASFAFMGTSMVRHELPKGTIYLGKSYTIKMPKDSILNKLNTLGYNWTYKNDTISNADFYNQSLGYYLIENVIIKDEDIIIDTLGNIKFALIGLKNNKTKIDLINVELSEPGNIQNWKYLKKMNRFYRKKIKEGLLKEVEE